MISKEEVCELSMRVKHWQCSESKGKEFLDIGIDPNLKLQWTCGKGHIWRATVKIVGIGGVGCPRCNS